MNARTRAGAGGLLAAALVACSSTIAGPPPAVSPSSAPAVTIVEFSLKSVSDKPDLIAFGSDGAMWFAESGGNKIGRIPADASAANQILEFSVPTAASEPIGIAAGSDGALWFTENNAKQVGRIPTDATVANPRITEYPAAPSQSPIGIAAGPDRSLWFGGYGGYAVARMTTAGRVAASFTATQRNTDNFAAGSDGAMWFVECNAPGAIGRITKAGHLSEEPVPATLGKKPRPLSIASGPDGNIWFADIGNDAIGKVLVTGSGIGAIVEIRLPRAHGRLTPQAITSGPDGALWFTAATPTGAGFVGRIPVTATGSGDVILYPIPTKSTLFYGIASDRAGSIWFTEYDAGKLGRLTIGPGNDSPPSNR